MTMSLALRHIEGLQSFREDQERALKEISSRLDQDFPWAAIRSVQETTHWRGVRDEKPALNSITLERGACIELLVHGQFIYVSTASLTYQSLMQAFEQGLKTGKSLKDRNIFSFNVNQRPKATGRFHSFRKQELDRTTLRELSELLLKTNKKLKVSEKIVDRRSESMIVECETSYLSTNGSDLYQNFLSIAQHYSATAKDAHDSQTRSMKGQLGHVYQIGPEIWDEDELCHESERIGREALELLTADNCPEDERSLLLAPDQMVLQIHESIGHPLELDRILGDERNYAGWSFVKPTDFGNLQYGSPLLNCTFDPTVPHELASYAFDDCGNHATREYLIRNGKLERGLGSFESQVRIQKSGVANFRSASWNRAPIDRMANINIEPGTSTLAEMIAKTEKGIYMETNRSWSIDDYRNKFQFGCEHARLIEDGRLTRVVKNPNYRGSTVSFWNSLQAVGSAEEIEVSGSPYCGKGEPSQVIRVGHSSPPCLFTGVQIFGGGQ